MYICSVLSYIPMSAEINIHRISDSRTNHVGNELKTLAPVGDAININNMKIIVINSPKYGKFESLVDDCEYDDLITDKWSITLNRNGDFYAHRSTYDKNTKKKGSVKMHQQIMSTPKNMHTDHINHNTLDNRRCNLRICTAAQNQMNKQACKNSMSGLKGVGYRANKYISKKAGHKKLLNQYWTATIMFNGKQNFLGNFPYTEQGKIDAAKAYNLKAVELFGEYANLNII